MPRVTLHDRLISCERDDKDVEHYLDADNSSRTRRTKLPVPNPSARMLSWRRKRDDLHAQIHRKCNSNNVNTMKKVI